MDPALRVWANEAASRVEALLVGRFSDAWPNRFAEACVYPLQTGGKRMRPLLCLAAAEAIGGDPAGQAALCAAGALELVHTYSLVHDDLPSMDDDDERRGRPTVHVVYGDGPAVLVGDALLTEAFALLAEAGPTAPLLVAELARAAGHRGMIGGQAADVGMGGPVRDLDALLRCHRGKTGALLRAAARMGGIAAGADGCALAALTAYGEAVGLAFQLADDVLDADQDAGDAGPPSYVRLLGLAETERRARALLDDALAALAPLPAPAKLNALARYTVERDH